MTISSIFSFLVHPGKSLDPQPEIGGTPVPLQGNLFQMLSNLLETADSECRIEIAFSPSSDGSQTNPCRDDIVSVLQDSTLENARNLAIRLQSVTDRRSGLGLLFIIVANEGDEHTLLVSRFAADYGVIAEENRERLTVEFVEQVFMRNVYAYKAVVYKGNSFDSEFWSGRAVDRQVNNRQVELSGYWIKEFLMSDFKTTAAAGTRRLACALHKVISSNEESSVKMEIMAAAQLANNLEGQMTSISRFMQQFRLSNEAKEALIGKLSNADLAQEQFTFTHEEFLKHVRYQAIELDNGAMLSAKVDQFATCFSQEEVAESPGEYAFRTQGRIVEHKLRQRK